MSDGQEKSDDLIAELAKLMASGAGEPEAKPGPKLVAPAEPEAEAPRPAAPVVRIPGMDLPPSSGPTSPLPAPSVAAEKPAAPVPTIRIPGMDQPVAAQPAPRPVAEPPAAPPVPVFPAAEARPEPPKVRALDFGTLPPAATIRPEPMSNWQDREIPKPVAARPPVAAEPVLTPPVAAEPRPAAPEPRPAVAEPRQATPEPRLAAPAPRPAGPAPAMMAPAARPSTAFTPPPPARPAEPVQIPELAADEEFTIAGKPAPEGDGFDFDFGFANNPPAAPEPEAPAPIAAAPVNVPRPAPEPVATSGDPIADLISAELDAAEAEEPMPAPVPARPPVQPPAIRSFQPAAPAPATPAPAPAVPQQQRSVTTNPVRPPVAPQPPAPEIRPVAAESDRFSTAPVFGVGAGKPMPAPAPVERDPMDEIESLIGEAVRVELATPEKPAAVVPPARPQAAPVVPPLNTAFAPRRAAIKDTEPQIASAEAAILAAAAAAGSEAPRLDGNVAGGQQTSYTRPKAKPEKKRGLAGGMRQYIGMAVAGTLLLAAGFGLYWVLGMGRGNDAEAPVLQADATPAKEAAPVTVPKEDAQGSVVFNELDGKSAAAPADEQLVSRDDSADTSIADVAETVGAGNSDASGAAAASGDGSESELANRKVRTVTVRPDGTVVSGDDAVAGNEALPVDRPQVPEVPGADVQPSELLAELPANGAATPATATANGAAANVAVDSANINPSIVAPIPMARPANRAALGGGSSQRVAAVNNNTPVDLTGGNSAPAAAPAVSNASGAYVQLSSQPTSGDAQASLRTTQNRLSRILNGRSLEIRQVDLGAKGVWYRVVLPVNSFSEATQACAAFKANGTDCLPING